jgi:outer membrane protein OmpA-like peptidoglycan-associated protein
MAISYQRVASRLACAILLRGLISSTLGLPIPAAAQDVPADQIIKALTPVPATRSLTVPKEPVTNEADQRFVDSLRNRKRSLTVDEKDHVTEIAKGRPKIDLEVYFDSGSAAIASRAKPQLNELGEALRHPHIEGSLIVVAGHTDAVGSDEYNQRLSERRAEAVKRYLIESLRISPENLTTAGYGKRDPKNKSDPFAAQNRRVEIINLASSNEAKR